MASQDYLGAISLDSYLLPCPLKVIENNFLIEMDIRLILPIIDFLLGGAGTTVSDAVRELTESMKRSCRV